MASHHDMTFIDPCHPVPDIMINDGHGCRQDEWHDGGQGDRHVVEMEIMFCVPVIVCMYNTGNTIILIYV